LFSYFVVFLSFSVCGGWWFIFWPAPRFGGGGGFKPPPPQNLPPLDTPLRPHVSTVLSLTGQIR